MRIPQKMVFVVAVAILVAGCGGGSSSNSAPTTYNLDAAISAYSRNTHNYSLTGSSGGNNFSLRLSSVPGSTAVFGTQTTDTSTNTVEIFENGALIGSDSATRYYDVNPYKQIGIYDSTTGYVTVFGSQQHLPTAAQVGDTGTLSTGTTYYDTSLTTVFGTQTDTWTLSAGSGGDAVLCADTVADTTSGIESESDCYTVNSAGNVAGLTITLLISGTTITFQ